MKEPHLPSIPIPAPRKRRSVQERKSDQNTIRLPQFILYRTLCDNIIWLDLFINERDFTFANKMITANRLHIFCTATDCHDFLDLLSRRLDLITKRDIYSVIVSGVYVINIKVVDQLLKHEFIDQIWLIVNEHYYEQLPDLFLFNRKIKMIYNYNPDMVMRRLCDDYSDFETFTQYYNTLYEIANDSANSLLSDVLPEGVNHKIGCSYRWKIHHNSSFTHLIENAKCDRSTAFRTPDKNSSNDDNCSSLTKVTFSQMTQTNQLEEENLNEKANNTSPSICRAYNQNIGLSSRKNLSSSFVDPSSCHGQQPTLIKSPLSSPSRYSNDMIVLQELQRIKDDLALLNQLVDKLSMKKLTRDDDVYKHIENEALKLMMSCDALTDVSPAVATVRRETVHNIQKMLDTLDRKVSLYGPQMTGIIYSISV
ncbi:unnamed protein product [Rotaria sordida]|uniref:Uncharacterized protein n=1 Tax=Rotaria sordida TaxID=392033 RepID=A0A815CA22_9BILA|nr:unnamed protein product [Rotaria sordida]